MSVTTIRFSDEESRLIKSYAQAQRRTVSDVIRLAILDQIEDEYDLGLFKQAKAEYEADSAFITHEEMMKKYGLRD